MYKIIVFIFISSFLNAETLKGILHETLISNPLLNEQINNYKIIKEDLNIAKTGYFPTIDLNSNFGGEINKNSDNLIEDKYLNYYENSLSVILNLFNGFSDINNIKYQENKLISSSYQFIEKSNQLSISLTEYYINILKNKALYENTKENVKINKEILEKVLLLYNYGIATKSEMTKIKSSLSLAKSNKIVQYNSLINDKYKLKKIYGKTIDINNIKELNTEILLPDDFEEIKKISLTNNPSIIIMDYNYKSSKYLVKKGINKYYPKIDLSIEKNINSNTYGIETDTDRFRFGIKLSYNLYNGGKDKYEINKLKLENLKNRNQKNNLKREILEGLELSWNSIIELKKQLKELNDYNKYSKETLELYKKEYNLGRKSLLDLLSTQNDFINSKSRIITVNYNILFEKYKILNYMGVLVKTILGDEYSFKLK